MLITGCGRYGGLGRAIALAMAQAGADVVVVDVRDEGTRNSGEPSDLTPVSWLGLPSLVDEVKGLGRQALSVVGDVGVKADVERIVGAAIDRFGAVDILVNNAGAPHGADRNWSWETPEAAFDEQLRVNTKGTFLMSTAVVRSLLARERAGRIVNIASLAARVGLPMRAAYSASKFAIIGLTQSMAAELAPRKITVNAICPGTIATDRNAASRARATKGDQADPMQAVVLGSPVGRLGTPADVARVAVHLASPGADFVTGQAIGVNGGQDFR